MKWFLLCDILGLVVFNVRTDSFLLAGRKKLSDWKCSQRRKEPPAWNTLIDLVTPGVDGSISAANTLDFSPKKNSCRTISLARLGTISRPVKIPFACLSWSPRLEIIIGFLLFTFFFLISVSFPSRNSQKEKNKERQKLRTTYSWLRV